MDVVTIKKEFPPYFANFSLPSAAKEQEIEVYRACVTRRIDQNSFLNSYEENGNQVVSGGDVNDPQQYCLSTYWKLKDVKRFVVIDSSYNPPFVLAKGHTTITDGVSCKTAEWKRCKSSHVDWWLYINAKPWLAFKETTYENELENLSRKEQRITNTL